MRVYPLWLIVDGHMSNKKIGERASVVMMDTNRLQKGYMSRPLCACCVASVFTRLQHNQVKCKGRGGALTLVWMFVWMFGWLAVGAGDTDFGCPEKTK